MAPVSKKNYVKTAAPLNWIKTNRNGDAPCQLFTGGASRKFWCEKMRTHLTRDCDFALVTTHLF
jgi:hypothetical protein